MSFRHEQRIPSATWAVVADRGRARIFAWSGEDISEIEEIESLTCPEGASHPHDLVSDKQGYFKGHSGSMQTGDPKTDFKHRAAERFAHRIVQLLDEARVRNQFGKLVLVAPPMFMGELRSHIKEPMARMIDRQITKDYTALPAREIAELLTVEPDVELENGTPECHFEEIFESNCLDDVVVVTLAGDLGEFDLERIHTCAERALHQFEVDPHKRHVVLDFKKTNYFGSSAMGFFTRLWKRVQVKGGNMVVCNLSALEEELLRVTQLDTLWPTCDSLTAAIESARGVSSPTAK